MRRKFISSLSLLLVLNLLIKPIWIFGIDLSVQNRLGEEVYGLYSALFGFSIIFNILLDFGLTHFNNQAIAKKADLIERNFSRIFSIKLFLAFIYIFFSLIVAMLIGYEGFAFKLLIFLSINQFLASLLLFLRSNISGLQLFKTDAVLSVLDKSLMILSCGLLLFYPWPNYSFEILDFVLAQSFSYGVAVLIAFIAVYRKAGYFKIDISFQSLKKNLLDSWPYALLILLMALYTKVDSVMIDRIVGSTEVAYYAAAYRLLESVNQLPYLFSIILLPMFSKMFSKNEDLSGLVKLSFSLILTILVAVSVASFMHAGAIIQLLYPDPAYSQSVEILRVLILSSLSFGALFVFGTLLTAKGSLKLLNSISAIGFTANILLNFALIPRYGAYGAAVATFITQGLMAISQIIVGTRTGQLDLGLKYWASLMLFFAISGGIAFGLQQIEISALLSFSLCFVLIPLTALFLGLLDLKSAIHLVKQRFS